MVPIKIQRFILSQKQQTDCPIIFTSDNNINLNSYTYNKPSSWTNTCLN